jgi:hypothetical protein
MANIANSPVACCAGTDLSGECSDVKPSLGCQGVLQNYCSQGNNIFGDSNCLTASQNGALAPSWVVNQKMSYCSQGNNFNDPNCQTLCTATTGIDNGTMLSQGTSLKSQCNTLYANQCSMTQNQGLPICSCSLPWSSYPGAADILKIPGATQNPQCFFANCIHTGYKSQPSNQLACPECVQNLNISALNSDAASFSNIQQSCTVQNTTNNSNAAPTTAPATSAPASANASNATAATTGTNSTSTVTYIIIAVILFLVCCFCSSIGGVLVL